MRACEIAFQLGFQPIKLILRQTLSIGRVMDQGPAGTRRIFQQSLGPNRAAIMQIHGLRCGRERREASAILCGVKQTHMKQGTSPCRHIARKAARAAPRHITDLLRPARGLAFGVCAHLHRIRPMRDQSDGRVPA